MRLSYVSLSNIVGVTTHSFDAWRTYCCRQVQVIGGADGRHVLATLEAGSVFGEIALLGGGGMNRRTADVISRGFSNIFVLQKTDLEMVLKNYPDAKQILNVRAKRLMKENEHRHKQEQGGGGGRGGGGGAGGGSLLQSPPLPDQKEQQGDTEKVGEKRSIWESFRNCLHTTFCVTSHFAKF